LATEAFLDTNVLIYAASGRIDAPEKHSTAQGLLTTSFGVSGQVLAEFYVNVTQRGMQPMSSAEAKEWVRHLSRKPCQIVDSALVQSAIEVSERFQTSYWDAAIIAAAQRLGAKTLYSEDLNHGQAYGSVTVVNPFLNL
jgi:predicted nucleic acid-binding protein